MKRVPWSSVKFYSLFILSLTAILMLESSCAQEETIERPSATFIIKGKAVSDEDQKPLENVLVVMLENTAGIGPVKDVKFMATKDSAITDKEGNFEVIDSLGIPARTSYTLLFSKPANELKSTDERINNSFTYEFSAPRFTKGDGHWYCGQTSAEQTFSLKTKIE